MQPDTVLKRREPREIFKTSIRAIPNKAASQMVSLYELVQRNSRVPIGTHTTLKGAQISSNISLTSTAG